MTGLFHIVPEIGYMLGDDFALAAQLRLEFIKQEQALYTDPRTKELHTLPNTWVSGEPTTMAAAGFARAIWYTDLSSDGNFRLSYSVDLGGGFVRLPVRPVAAVDFDNDGNVITNKDRSIPLTDTRPVGMVLGGASVGMGWHPSRHFGVALEGRFLTGAPSFGAVLEGSLSFQLAFGGVKGPPQPEGEEGEEEIPLPEEGAPGESTTMEEELPPEDLGPEE
jgi:hypothetical protein